MALNAARLSTYTYPSGQDPEGAFDWWLSPCGGSDLVPDDIKKAFDILNTVAGSVGSFKPPAKVKPGSGKKGDEGNPNDRTKPTTKPTATESCTADPKVTGGVHNVRGLDIAAGKCQKPSKCVVKTPRYRMGSQKNTIRNVQCVNNQPVTNDVVVTSVVYKPNPTATTFTATCSAKWTQACYHYSSVIRNHKDWAVLTCPPAAGTTGYRMDAAATNEWSNQHKGAGWKEKKSWPKTCDRDEYPPAYLLSNTDTAYVKAGKDATGQMVRYVPDEENRGAGSLWGSLCLREPLLALNPDEIMNRANQHGFGATVRTRKVRTNTWTETQVGITVDHRPRFTIGSWGHAANPLPDDGLSANPCWPSAAAPDDPGFALMTYDPWYQGKPPPYKYNQDYDPEDGNGV
jgi:hypothetical protein